MNRIRFKNQICIRERAEIHRLFAITTDQITKSITPLHAVRTEVNNSIKSQLLTPACVYLEFPGI